MPQNDKALLLRLTDRQVEFVIIGGVCGVLHGISLVTRNILYRMTPSATKWTELNAPELTFAGPDT